MHFCTQKQWRKAFVLLHSEPSGGRVWSVGEQSDMGSVIMGCTTFCSSGAVLEMEPYFTAVRSHLQLIIALFFSQKKKKEVQTPDWILDSNEIKEGNY